MLCTDFLRQCFVPFFVSRDVLDDFDSPGVLRSHFFQFGSARVCGIARAGIDNGMWFFGRDIIDEG
jgi:hypothetical protein